MQINIEIDEKVIEDAMAFTGLHTSEAALEQAVRDFVQHKRRVAAFNAMRGTGWDGDLDVIRGRKEPS